MIKWRKCEENLNIKDIMKVIHILPCSLADYYDEENDCLTPTLPDGDNIIYVIKDASDGYVVMYYKCSADGTIIEVGLEEYDWQ